MAGSSGLPRVRSVAPRVRPTTGFLGVDLAMGSERLGDLSLDPMVAARPRVDPAPGVLPRADPAPAAHPCVDPALATTEGGESDGSDGDDERWG